MVALIEQQNQRFLDGPFKGLLKGHYKVLYADPPWSFATWSHRGEGKGASQHYDCLRLGDIKALPMSDLAQDDAALFLWVVQPMLPEALELVEAWGFKFRTVAFAWVKMPKAWADDLQGHLIGGQRLRPKMGLGYHTRSGMEQCWLAIRGNGYKRASQGIEQVLHAPIREHSRKPDEIANRIEGLVGDVPCIELFARRRRLRWDAWGNELEKFRTGDEA